MAKFDLKKFQALVLLLAPAVLLAVPGGEKIAPFVPVIATAIVAAEAIPGATGPEKRAHVLTIVAAGVTVANASGKLTLDPTEVATVAGKGIDAVIGTLHIVAGAKVAKLPPAA
jgi:hypothetical protein